MSQTLENFELIVVNDSSSDRTLEILSSIRDGRMRVLTNAENLGIVASLNRAMGEASGRFIARIDADDFCQPTRFARQFAFLNDHPSTLLVGTEMSVLDRGRIKFNRQHSDSDPMVLRWMLHVDNPIGHPSMMFRSEVIDKLGCYLREEFKYAEDFDFLHRILKHGEIAVIPEYLVIYRAHSQNITRTRRAEMISRTADILRDVYSTLFGEDRAVDAALVANHLIAQVPPKDPTALKRLGNFLNQSLERFDGTYGLDDEQRRRVYMYTGKLWWRTIQSALRAGHFSVPIRSYGHYCWSAETRPPNCQLARAAASGLRRNRPRRKPATLVHQTKADGGKIQIDGVDFEEVAIREDDQPTLYVVVDTEAEFDWSEQFDRSLTSVSAMNQQFRAQAIFDHYGARPIYVIDYAVASQAEGYEPLREIFDRRACAIGAHLHSWVNPPFEETFSKRNSFSGNLLPALEERKLRALISVIKANFGISPLFYKAGRYGVGRETMDMLSRLGFVVDFSILPLSDLRHYGCLDFRYIKAKPYRVGVGRILSIPMSRGQVGLLTPLPPLLHSALRSPLPIRLHLPGILSRTRLANTVTLTPEGVSAEEQIQLIRSMIACGLRTFTLHYHSPSLGMHTPYVTSEKSLRDFLRNLEAVCRFFFENLGGLPGNPVDLVPVSRREEVWPQQR